MKSRIVLFFLALICIFSFREVYAQTASKGDTVIIKFIETTDVHGSIFPYNFITDKPATTSLAQVYSLVKEERAKNNQYLVLLDNGDILQGQPVVYYYNFENNKSTHIISDVMNFMKYDAAGVGNHDIEAGHAVYDKLIKEFKFPWLCANAVADGKNSPYFKPYIILKRGKVKIAVLGLITPWIPNWLPKQFWEGMSFQDMVASANQWINEIKQNEKPDVIIGLFHAGVDYTYGGANIDTPFNENASQIVAEKVPGFDIIFVGHDHAGWSKTVKNTEGKDVWIFGGVNDVKKIPLVTLTMKYDKTSKSWDKSIEGNLLDVSNLKADDKFLNKFNKQYTEVKNYVNRPIGKMTKKITTRDSMFGDSPFVDLIHKIQLELVGNPEFNLNKAEISFAAPLAFDATIPSSADGTLYVRDMFNLYVYENFLYTMNLTGQQIKDFLEYSYNGWLNQMKDENDHLLNFKKDNNGNVIIDNKTNLPMLNVRYYNYDSAAGIIYSVDVTKPVGERIIIKSMANGDAFDLTKTYSVAINSYRAQGGGGHLEKGSKLSSSDIREMKFVTSSTIKDLRFYLMKWIEGQKTLITPESLNNWIVIPENYWNKGKVLDYPLLFPVKK